jgi:hypothetical protein
MHEPEAIDSV